MFLEACLQCLATPIAASASVAAGAPAAFSLSEYIQQVHATVRRRRPQGRTDGRGRRANERASERTVGRKEGRKEGKREERATFIQRRRRQEKIKATESPRSRVKSMEKRLRRIGTPSSGR